MGVRIRIDYKSERLGFVFDVITVDLRPAKLNCEYIIDGYN